MTDITKNKNPSSLHQGHRQRVRERISDTGFDSLPDHEFIEFLLFYVIPRRNVNPLAHELLDTFDGIHGLFNTYSPRFHKYTNLSDTTIKFIETYGDLIKEYIECRKRILEIPIKHDQKLELTKSLIGKERRTVMVLLADNAGCYMMSREFSLDDGFCDELIDSILFYALSAEVCRISIVSIIPEFDNNSSYFNPNYIYSSEKLKNFCEVISTYSSSRGMLFDGLLIARKIFTIYCEVYQF